MITESEVQTIRYASIFARSLKAGDVVSLEGELGAGKTVFAKGVAQGLGIDEDVTSPTYAYMNDYDGKLYHFDFYRLSSGTQAEALGLTDYFYSNGICLIEWAQNVKEVLPDNIITVSIKKLSENKREIIVR